MTIEFNKVVLDTAPLIYFLDAGVNFGEKTKAILEEILAAGKSLVSSVITCEEYLIYPYRLGATGRSGREARLPIRAGPRLELRRFPGANSRPSLVGDGSLYLS